jgi:2-oxoisovalerate dehydrogenase E1 component alpha subunit
VTDSPGRPRAATGQADAVPELVQLLTPEGERVEHPDYALDIGP